MSATTDNGGFLIMECKVNGCTSEVLAKGLCKKCYHKARYEVKKEHILTQNKAYNKANKKKIKTYKKEYYLSNKETVDDYKKNYRKLKPLYTTWENMKQRCYNPNSVNYKYYGGRGVKVCDRWFNSYESFALDMGERPDGCSIDRIDVNGNYEPDNCKWSTLKEQNNNRRNNKQA